MNYRITHKIVDFLPNVLEFITDPTIKGEVVGEQEKLSVFNFTDDSEIIGVLVVAHRNWQGSVAINNEVFVGEWDSPTNTLFIDANGGSYQVVGDQLVVELASPVV